VAKSGRLGKSGVRRGPRNDEVRRKFDMGVNLDVVVVVVGVVVCGLPSVLVKEVDMLDVVVTVDGSLSGGVLGEQSSSS